jgi:AcrR family transcriptional regulator
MTADPQVHDGEQPLRADARRNREQIIDAARVIFAEHGAEVPMEEIAKRAGVGVGTLYRRFPDRDALIRAVAVHAFGRLLTEADDAQREESSAWDALVRVFRQARELQVSMQLAMFSPRAHEIMRKDEEISEVRGKLLEVLERVVIAAQEEGELRSDVGTGDVAVFFAMSLRKLGANTPELSGLITERCLALILDGLRARPGTLPGRQLTSEDLNLGR